MSHAAPRREEVGCIIRGRIAGMACLAIVSVLPILSGCLPPEPVAPHDITFGSGIYLDRTLFDSSRMDAIIDQAAAAGVQWSREEFHWNMIEPARGLFDQEVLDRQDRVVAQLSAHGLRVLGLLAYTTPWSSGETAPDTGAEREDYARFAGAMAARYQGQVDYWEIWNEPNLGHFWKPESDVAAYGALLAAAARAIRAANPNVVICGGSTSGADRAFILESLQAAGPGAVDVITFHPYCGDTPEWH